MSVDVETGLTPLAEPEPLGELVLNYRITRRIGEGGMGVVYRAEHTVLAKKAAIKVLRASFAKDAQWAQGFLAEANTLGRLNHRNIVKIENIDTLKDGRLCIVMEYLDGQTLRELMDANHAVGPWEAVNFTLEILGALAAAHSERIFHRDIKPENVFIVRERAGDPYAKVMDFGLAAAAPVTTDSGPLPEARQSLRAGTPQYVAPEQAEGLPPTAAADLYALGTMLFEMLTGRLPLSANTVGEWVWAQQNAPAPRLDAIDPTIPSALADVVDELMHKDPGARPQSATAVRNRLEVILETLERPHSHARTDIVQLDAASAAKLGRVSSVPQLAPQSAPSAAKAGQVVVHAPAGPQVTASTKTAVLTRPQPAAPSDPPARSRTPAAVALVGGLAALGLIASFAWPRADRADRPPSAPTPLTTVPAPPTPSAAAPSPAPTPTAQ